MFVVVGLSVCLSLLSLPPMIQKLLGTESFSHFLLVSTSLMSTTDKAHTNFSSSTYLPISRNSRF